MPVRVLKISSVAAPKRLLRRFDYGCPGFLRALHNGINVFFAGDIVADAEFRGACGGWGDRGVLGETLARAERELHAVLQLKEHHGSIGKFFADDSLRWESQPIAIKRQRCLQVIDADGEDGNAGLHLNSHSLAVHAAATSPPRTSHAVERKLEIPVATTRVAGHRSRESLVGGD